MALEDTLNTLNQTLQSQSRTNEALASAIISFITRNESQASETSAILAGLNEVIKQSRADQANETHTLQIAAQSFADAANQTQYNVTELGRLIQLMGKQLEQQNKSLGLQNEAIQTEIRLARESSRSGWIQNGIFFFLGILIPVIVQIVFRVLNP